MQRKTLLVIIGASAIAIVLIVVLIFMFRGDSEIIESQDAITASNLPSAEDSNGESGISEEFPALKLPIFSKIIDLEVISPVLSDSGEEIYYYDEELGDFYSVNIDGSNSKALSDKQFTRVIDIVWSPKRDKVIITFKGKEEGNDNKIYVYDLFTKSLTKLDSHITSPAFSPDGDEIVYQYIDKEKRIYNISTVSAEGKNFDKILDFYSPGASIAWDEAFKTIFITDYPSNQILSNLYSLTPTKNKVNKLLRPVYGLQVVFSPKGDGMIYSSISPDQKKLLLSYADKDGQPKRELHISTFASKVVIGHDGKFAYAAVPTQLPSTINIANYLPSGRELTKDNIWRINLETGEKTTIAKPYDHGYVIDAKKLFMSHDGKILFFWDRGDKGVYAVNVLKAEEEEGLNSSSSGTEANMANSPLDSLIESEEETDENSEESSDTENKSDTNASKETPEERLFKKIGF